jgi:Arc/MetJ-type ribon-helix-helix transcriptional regulator
MSYAFPPPLDRWVHEFLDTGAYRSEDEMLLEAFQALRDRNEAVVGIQEGLADVEVGRARPLRNEDEELRKKYSIPR